MTDYYLWFDAETSDLNLADLTVFEAGWTVTDAQLQQLTPLRSALLNIPTGPDLPTLHWPADLLPEVVADMHEASGLRAEWEAASTLVDSVEGLDALLQKDLASARCGEEDKLFLAGAGVGHYDHPLLGVLGSSIHPKLHYRSADVSSALQVFGLPAPKSPKQLERLWEAVEDPGGYAEDAMELLELAVDASTSRLTTVIPSGYLEGSERLDFGAVREHRAADDVAFALVVARCYRAFMPLLTLDD